MLKNRMSRAFTLAEVLITLAVIGIVAALTIPAMLANHRKVVVETKLAKFYSSINQAIQMSEIVNGDKKTWDEIGQHFEQDEEGNWDYTKPLAMAWFEKYLQHYIRYTKVETFNDSNTDGCVLIYFPDGSMFMLARNACIFYPDANKFQVKKNDEGLSYRVKSVTGKDAFVFFFEPFYNITYYKYHYNKGIEPFLCGWDGNRQTLFDNPAIGCRADATNEPAYCTALIMLNGWKIPKDYPFKF